MFVFGYWGSVELLIFIHNENDEIHRAELFEIDSYIFVQFDFIFAHVERIFTITNARAVFGVLLDAAHVGDVGRAGHEFIVGVWFGILVFS